MVLRIFGALKSVDEGETWRLIRIDFVFEDGQDATEKYKPELMKKFRKLRIKTESTS
jgi:hypothetical protein